MSVHKNHHHVTVDVDPGRGPAIVVYFRRAWQAWLLHRLLERAVGAQHDGGRR